MKKVLFQFSLLCLLMSLFSMSCAPVALEMPKFVSSGSSPTKYPSYRIVSRTQSLNANATKKGESFTKTYTLKIDSLFKDKFGFTDLSKLDRVNVNSFKVEFDQANCVKLDNYLVEANFPVFGKLTNSDCNLATDFGQSTAFGKSVKGTDFSKAIKNGESITVTFTMTAKEDIPAGVGVTINTEVYIQFFE
jgi:hypothetical protein